MKLSKIFILITVLLIGKSFAQVVNGNLAYNEDDSKLTVTVKIQLNESSSKLGNATIKIKYDPSKLTIPDNPESDIDYIFKNFSDDDYFPGTVKKSKFGVLSINVTYKMGSGETVSTSPSEIIEIYFDKLDAQSVAYPDWAEYEFFSPGAREKWITGTFGSETITSSDDESPSLINSFQVNDNYPNPFNPSTSAKYQLPSAGLVQISIFNVLGQSVAVYNEGHKNAGVHQFVWNASNLASGSYFVQFNFTDQSNKNFTQTKKMVLIK